MTGTSKGAKKAAKTRKARKEEFAANQINDRDEAHSQSGSKSGKDLKSQTRE